MKARVLILAVIAAAALVYLLKASGGSGDSSDFESARQLEFHYRVPGAAASPAVTAPLRNVFQYADAGPSAAAPAVTAPAAAAPVTVAPAPPPPPVRLVGLLRRGGGVQAALTILGDTVVLAPGESSAGYTVLAIDEEEGVRLRGPDGSTLVLTPTSE